SAPEYYAVVPAEFEFPAVDYEVLAELHLRNPDSDLYRQSFSNHNLETEYSYIHYPQEEPCPPACSGGGGGGNGAGPGGCYKPYDQSRPAGVIEVNDSELGFRPVRRCKVIFKDNWFTEEEVWTNDQGCFKASGSYTNHIRMWVKFKNARAGIRSAAVGGRSVFEWMGPVKDYVGKFDEDDAPVNALRVRYMDGGGNGSKAHQYWAAATVLNTVSEFHDFAAHDAIFTPPHDLNMYMGRNHTFGYALMARKINSLSYTNYLMSNTTTGNWAAAASVVVPFTGLGVIGTLSLMPDVYIGIDYTQSDRLKQLIFHELAHASHFQLVGSTYWQALAALLIEHDDENGQPYGDGTYADAGRVALAESWAEHIGDIYAHRIYGPSTSLIPTGRTYERQIELTIMRSTFIPDGLHHDLNDIGELAVGIVDNVEGFTYEQMYFSLGNGTLTLQQYQDNLINNYLGLTPNTINQVNDLFNSY
ncbi:MAG: hypothetical protein ACPF9D_12320, partial [Owenweeksia sp.]